MIFRKVILLFIVGLIVPNFCLSIDPIKLVRVTTPLKTQIDQEKNSMNRRELNRSLIRFGSTAGILVMLYATYKATLYFQDTNQQIKSVDQRVSGIEKGIAPIKKDTPVHVPKIPEAQGSLTAMQMVVDGLKASAIGTKDFVRDIGKCLIQTSLTVIPGMVLNSLWQSVAHRIVEASKQESISWYITNHTQLWPVLDDLKSSCIPYDIHSELLSLEQSKNKSGVQLKAVIADMVELSKESSNLKEQELYFDYCCKDLQKKYAKSGDELELLQNYAAPHIAQKKRAVESGLAATQLFANEEIVKHNIADLCTVVAGQIQKVVSFSMMHIDNGRSTLQQATVERGEKRVQLMIDAANKYFDAMEQLLNMNLKDLEAMSMANKGMFTCTYEFDRLFKEYSTALNRYCMLIK